MDGRTIERTYEDWSSETYARTKEIGSQAVMNRVFAKNDEDVTLIFGVSRRDGSSGKIYQASRCPSLFLLPFRGCVYETADHSLVLVSLPRCTVETCFERITGTERIRASRKSLSYSPSLSLRDLHTILDRENPPFPVLTNIWLIRNKYSLRTNFSMTLRSILRIFFLEFFFLPLESSSIRKKKKEREKHPVFVLYGDAIRREKERWLRNKEKEKKNKRLLRNSRRKDRFHVLCSPVTSFSPLSSARGKAPLRGKDKRRYEKS